MPCELPKAIYQNDAISHFVFLSSQIHIFSEPGYRIVRYIILKVIAGLIKTKTVQDILPLIGDQIVIYNF